MKSLDEAKKLLGRLPLTDRPLALFPVQVQARFVTRQGGAPSGAQAQLLVRVYPDELHIDSHEAELTAAEVDWGRRYWEQIWPARGDRELQRQAWEQLSGRFGTRRAAWIARRLTPDNLNQRPPAGSSVPPPVFPDPGALKAEAWTLPAQARLLPDRWVVAGFIGGERVLLEVGAPVPDALPVSLAPDEAPEIPDGAGEEALAIDEGMRWMVDFEEAERLGMGIRIVLPPEVIGRKLDRLLVFGVRKSLGVSKSAEAFENQLDAQHYTRGLAFAAPGTPTNNSPTTASGFDSRSRNPFEVGIDPPRLSGNSDGARAASLLGIGRSVFSAVEGAARSTDLDARHMETALWPVTGGYYLQQILAQPGGEQPLFSEEQIEQARRYVVEFVRHAGLLPALRVGRQPYGLLPVLSLQLLAASPAGQNRFVSGLRRLEPVWRAAGERAPRLHPGSQDASDLVEILRMQPVSSGYRARLIFDSQYFTPQRVVRRSLDPNLRQHSLLLRRRLGQLTMEDLVGEGRVLDLLPTETAVLLEAPLVQRGGEVSGAALSPNYITFLRTASFDAVLNEEPPGGGDMKQLDALLYLLLRHSVLLAYIQVAARILVRRGSLPDGPFLEPALVDIVGGVKPARTRTLLRILDLDPALRASLHTLTAAQEPEASMLDELRRSLAHLEALPVDVLARQLSGCLDLFAYRLDAWITSLAAQRLVEMRAKRPRGLVIGGYGWLEDLQPRPRAAVRVAPPGEEQGGALFTAQEQGGFIHAPSLGQASAAALLRSGYLTQPGEGGSRPFAVDLSSERVRLAEWLLDGIRQGQTLGALLGYRFERGLHDLHLDRFIDSFRRVAALAAVYQAQERLREAQALPPGRFKVIQVRAAQAALSQALSQARQRRQYPDSADLTALERLAAVNVVDGLALSRLFESGALPFDQVNPALSNSDRQTLEVELRRLQEAVDALSDALTAEGVYQIALGNPARAAASVDSVAHGEIQPPELTFSSTPRPGAVVTHRLAAIFSGPAPAPLAQPRQYRANAEPRLNSWLRQMLGGLGSVRCQAEFLDAEGRVLGARRSLALSSLGISQLDAIYLSAASQPGQGAPSGAHADLERLLEYRFRRSAPAAIPLEASLRLIYERPANMAAAQLSLGEFMEVAAAFRKVILGSRPLQGRDLMQSETDPPSGLDAAEFRARADQAVSSLNQALAALSAARLASSSAGADDLAALEALRERLLDLFAFGFSDALPLSPRGAGLQLQAQLLAQAESLERQVSDRLAQAQGLEGGFERDGADAEQQVQHDLERFRLVFGRSFLALPQVRPVNAVELGRAFRASDAVQGGDPDQVLSWLQGSSRVRPSVSRLDGALSYAAALGRAPALELFVAQLPFAAGERWIALPALAGEAIPPGKLSLVAHLPRPFRPAQPLGGFLVDEWVEVIPAAEVTTGLAFQYDAPGSRPPQAILLAVTPPDVNRWEIEAIERTLHETLDLAHLRALDPQALSQDVILQRLLPAIYISLNLEGDTLSTDFGRAKR